MSRYRQSVHDYIAACEALLKSPDLSVAEEEAVGTMAGRLEENLCSGNEAG